MTEELLFFNHIKERYPRAYKAYLGAISLTNKVSKNQRLRDLYDVFDQQKIYVKISLKEDIVPINYSVDVYVIEYDSVVCKYSSLEQFNTRVEAEEKGFEEAFKILSERLSKKLMPSYHLAKAK